MAPKKKSCRRAQADQAEPTCECGLPAAQHCNRCSRPLCMATCGTITSDRAFCEGCDTEPAKQSEVEASEPTAGRKRRSMGTRMCDGTTTAASYPKFVKTFGSRDEAMQEFGAMVRCKSHCARVRKTIGSYTFLRCNLSKSEPSCKWARLLRMEHDGSCTLLSPEDPLDHNDSSGSKGVRGMANLAQRAEVVTLLGNKSHVTPKSVWRACVLDSESAESVKLKNVQALKRVLMRQRFTANRLGDLEKLVAKHKTIPNDEHAGYFVVSFVGHADGRPKVTLVATTRALLRRWGENAGSCTAHMDGGFKFNLLGWPLSCAGLSNAAGTFTCCSLTLTSSMQPIQQREGLQGFQHASIRACQSRATKCLWSMSDAESAFRDTMVQVLGTSPLMCWFHVKQAFQEWILKKCPGNRKQRESLWHKVSEDLDVLHRAQTRDDFKTRAKAILAKWHETGIEESSR